jgi:hypothetical protein
MIEPGKSSRMSTAPSKESNSPIGSINDAYVNLPDFKSDPFDLFEEFTAEDYKKEHGIHTPILVLLSKDKESIPLSVSSDESADDQELMTSPFKQSSPKLL